MATRIISWSDPEHIASPSLSKTPSIMSFDSILSGKSEVSLDDQSDPHMATMAGSQPTHTASQVIEPNGTRTSTSTTIYPEIDAADHDSSYMRHNKYFFKDGNVTFLVGNMLYCVHRYFFSRDSTYFSIRFAQLDIRDHEPLPAIISLGDIESKGFDAFLSILYPENFEGNDFSYEEWKSVLHLSTRWGFASIRRLALNSIKPPTPHDRLLLARSYSVDDWVVPALSALCERTTPLSLSEARQMSIEDVVLVSTVREDIRGHTLQVDSAEIPLRVEAEQLGALGLEIPDHLRFPKREALSSLELKRASIHEGGGELSAADLASGNMRVLKGEPAQLTKNGSGGQGKVAATGIVETGKEVLMINNVGIQGGDPEEDDNGVAICVPQVASGPESAPPVLPYYSVGWGISLPFGQLLSKCSECDCSALIAWGNRSDPKENGVVCVAHGLQAGVDIRDLKLRWTMKWRYRFISQAHEAALRAFLA